MPRRTLLSRALAAVSVSLFVAVGAGALISTPAAAADDLVGDWGPDGSVASDSAVTVRWDNVGNSTHNTVSRSDDAPLPHTNGKTYADLDADVRQAFLDNFGDIAVTVSQTTNLGNQTVNVSVTGIDMSAGLGNYLEVFQCWGAPLADGTPNPDAVAPDPETCQVGVGTDYIGSHTWRLASADAGLVEGGDWASLATGESAIPFRAVDGEIVANRLVDNPYFSTQTTNEITGLRDSAFAIGNDGTGVRPFEIQTSLESQGLGCGLQANDEIASTATCWLVIVPQQQIPDGPLAAFGTESPLSPTSWANRLQVRIEMADISGVCPGDKERVLIAGSELLRGAMASWIPAMCDQLDIGVGYTVLGDQQVRTAFEAGTRGAFVASDPAAPDEQTVYAPVALAGTVIAFRIDRQSSRTPAPELNLNPRLVAKLLTQSYRNGIDALTAGYQLEEKAPWSTTGLYESIQTDPEFLDLNPAIGLSIDPATGSDIVATVTDSDAARAVWEWIVSDPEARSFLSGCPDGSGMVINPFYSSRTYEGCEDDADALDDVADEWVSQTDTPDNYFYATPVYPPDSTVFPQPGWYQRDAVVIGGQEQAALKLGDMHPRLTTLADTGRSAARAVYPANRTWCAYLTDQTCVPPNPEGPQGVWKSSSVPQLYGQRTVMVVTDTVSAARFQLQTARLCATTDTGRADCVGADAESLAAAADRFVASGVDGVLEPGEPDYAAGAYPMTLPIYAGFDIAALPREEAEVFADVLDYVTGAGQSQGYQSGQLPPGYASLPASLVGDLDLAIEALRTGVIPGSNPQNPQPSAQNPTTVLPPSTFVPRPSQPTAPVAPSTGPADPEVIAQVGTTPVTEIGFPQFGLAGGLLAAIATGVASPIVGGGRKVRQ